MNVSDSQINTNQAFINQVNTTRLVIFVGFFLGLFISWGLLIGDAQGRVNILHLLVVYVFFPLASLLVSTVTIFFSKGINLASLTSLLPLWSQMQKRAFLLQKNQQHSKWKFYFQSQLAALSFSLASLLVLLILLISTDVNFIWRSTLLNAEQIFPVLELLASPWGFWQSAQPNLELLIHTQDSRIAANQSVVSYFSGWWQFILAAQIFYAFLLRLVAMSISLLILHHYSQKDKPFTNVVDSKSAHSIDSPIALASIVTNFDEDYALNNWCAIDSALLQSIQEIIRGKQKTIILAGPLASDSDQMVAERWQETQLLIVKGWEPPLAELSDFMQNGNGYLLPLDWNEKGLQKLQSKHINEWRRFVVNLPSWQLLQLEES